MFKVGRFLLFVLISLVLAVVMSRFVVAPFDYNRYRKTTESSLRDLDRIGSQYHRTVIARQIIRRLDEFQRRGINDVSLHFNKARAHAKVNAREDAVREYTAALGEEPRAEIYFALALTQLDNGARQKAIDNLVIAISANPAFTYVLRRYVDRSVAEEVLSSPELVEIRRKTGR